ncbi:MAG: DUF523 domain-containing protein [Myxococcota bacterium]
MEKRVAVVSRCLLGIRCRYDGVVRDYGVKKYLSNFEIVDVCPEMDIGLTVPRYPIRFIRRAKKIILIQRITHLKLKRRIENFSRKFLLGLERVDIFLLKSRSPSCGNGDCKVFLNLRDEDICGYTDGVFTIECKRLFPNIPIFNEENVNLIK